MAIPENVLNDFQHRTIVSVVNPRWFNPEHTMLVADVVFEELTELGVLEFSTYADIDTKHGLEIWNKAIAGDYGEIAEYVIPPEAIPDRVSSRQFSMQLIISGLKDSVDVWIASQDELTKCAYEKSSSFVKTDDMMQEGFTALGYTSEQIDQFFLAASKL